MKERIAFFPYDHKGNDYIKNFIDALSDYQVTGYKKNLLSNFGVKYVICHWRENKFINENGGVSLLGFFKELIRVILLRIMGCKVVSVIHNRYPHNTKKRSVKFVSLLQSMYYFFSFRILCHSPVFNKKYIYVPHPAYLNVDYSNRICSNRECFLVFGRISKYKKVEKIVKIFKEHPSFGALKIVGPCEDVDYLDELKKISPSNVIFDVGFKDSNSLRDEIIKSRAVFFGSDSEDMIVSGGIHLALTLNKKIICFGSDYNKWLHDNYPELNITLLSFDSYDSQNDFYHLSLDKFEIIDNSRYLKEHSFEMVQRYFSKAL